ncbi:hypothetical protein PybrP1_001753 [[Pythium] brassicae (nom. inval.)]|nr:hypothetical protein PybrP1_001753 [[Pythium] brassicae (nom. inval.)]
MQFVAAAALVASLAAGLSAAEMCAIDKLQDVMTTPYTMPCMSESGLELAKLSGAPTPTQIQNFCKTASCKSLLKAVLAQNPPDCTMPVINLKFRSELFDMLEKACAGSTATVNNATGPSNSTSPNKNTASNSSSDSTLDIDAGVTKADGNTVTTPTPTKTPAPTPAKSTGAPSFPVSLCASAFGIASALTLLL